MGDPIVESMGKPMCLNYGQSGRLMLMTVGQRISERLKALRMSQAELARRVGVDQSTINGLVRGSARSSQHLHRIARELRTTPAYLSGETEDPQGDAVLPEITLEERDWLDMLRVIAPKDRKALMQLARTLATSALAVAELQGKRHAFGGQG